MTHRDFPTLRSGSFATNARAWLESPGDPVRPRRAATVLLVRDGSAGPEAFVLRRVATMAFAPSVFVFPGGGVDAVDDAWLAGASESSVGVAPGVGTRLAQQMGLPVDEARPFIACAVREVEEEVGVVLGVPDLSVRGHWITPVFEPRRYDTWFFAARVPEGQAATGQTTESDQARWVRPADLLAERAADTAVLLPPTVVMLEELAAAADCADFLAAEPDLRPFMPELVDLGDRLVVRIHSI